MRWEGDAPDVPLPDQDARMVDGLRETALEDLGLETTLQEVLDLEGQHVIETHAALIEHTDADEPADEGVTLEETLRVLGVELEQLTRGTTDLGQDEANAPDLALVAEAVLAGELCGWKVGGRRVDGSDFRVCARVTENRTRTFSSASRRADSKGRRGTL